MSEADTPDSTTVADEGADSRYASDGKAPRTARGERTLRKILNAARHEFGERGFGETSIVAITARAKVALGTFYTYFDSKEAVFRALVRDMSEQVRDTVAPSVAGSTDALDAERRALGAFLGFVRENKAVYRIIDEAEFVDPVGFRQHYVTTADRIARRLHAAAERGETTPEVDQLDREVRAWALMGANVFLGLRFGVWGDEDPQRVAAAANRLIREGLGVR
ncbi:TetR/AcrR family transcriptional regulator [Sphingomonas sp. KRR8]|uniref:TetR/AcrR family transcriptional regulator n=1 Tax=Sphingomonas sp. KRR8 TaxID=2942996 RepID=UPI0020203A7A|nr:TetR/AcrR family transcriptional regulator [Sphingomonas sp. KRR8]URD60151.1 TetR/AcrR family transcriptional regulator [Sphingomonas sp. KRR8]